MQQTSKLSKEVSAFLDQLNHPFRKEIDFLRMLILETNSSISENIKWNGPNYYIENEDRITMRIQPPKKQAQLIFHRGAKKMQQPKDKLISNESSLLDWKENNRAVVTYKSLEEIENTKLELAKIVNEWINTIE